MKDIKNPTIEDFFNHFGAIGLLKRLFNFGCYNDSIFTYSFEPKEDEMHEISFIADDTLLSEMTGKELIELKRIQFFQYRLFFKISKGENWECFESATYRKENIANLN